MTVPGFPVDPLTGKEYVTPDTPTQCVAVGHASPLTGESVVVAVAPASDAAPVAPLILMMAAPEVVNESAPVRQSVAVGHAIAFVLIDDPGIVEVGVRVAPAGRALNPYKEHANATAAAVLRRTLRARRRDRN